MNLERCSDALLRRQQSRQVRVDLPDLAVRARYGYSVTPCRTWRSTGKVVAFIRSENEEGVALIDAACRQSVEKGRESGVIRLQRANVSGLTRSVGSAAGMLVVCVGNVRVCDGNPILLQRSNITEGHRGCHSIKSRKSNVPACVLNEVSIQVCQPCARADLRPNVFVPE